MGIIASPRVRRYALYFLAWTLVGLFFFSEALTQGIILRDPTPLWAQLASHMVGIYILASLSPIIFWLGRRFPIERKFWIRRIGCHLLFGAIFAIVELAIASEVFVLLGVVPLLPRSFSSTYTVILLADFHGSVVAYWVLLVGQHTFRYYRQYQERAQQALRLELHTSELQRQLTDAQLGALKAQLHPHFLFNTLNAIMVLVRQQRGQQAEETLSLLSDLLRCVLDDVEAQEVPLRRELEYLRLYLAIEQVRFQDRLRIEISVDPDLLDAAVPHMALQPIVENAIRHGIGKSSSAGRIQIRAVRSNDSLEIKVQDDGPGLRPPDSSQTQGIGLANTRARLHQLYGDASGLAVENGAAGGVVATILLPYHPVSESPQTELIEVHASDNVAG
jgi:two-component system, LytTR family, sensor kinase